MIMIIEVTFQLSLLLSLVLPHAHIGNSGSTHEQKVMMMMMMIEVTSSSDHIPLCSLI